LMSPVGIAATGYRCLRRGIAVPNAGARGRSSLRRSIKSTSVCLARRHPGAFLNPFFDYCPHCGTQLPLDHDPRRIYCCLKCTHAAYAALVTRQLREARSGKTCRQCGSKFDAKYLSHQIFCSRRCNQAYHNGIRSQRSAAARAVQRCETCGEPLIARRVARFCSNRCTKRARSRYRGGR
jgi:hypothetical protein